MKFLFLVSLALSSLFANATGMPAITQTEDLQNALSQGFPDNCPFVTMGTVALYLRPLSTNATLTILSNGTRVKLREKTIGPRPRLSIGDTVRVSGRTKKRHTLRRIRVSHGPGV